MAIFHRKSKNKNGVNDMVGQEKIRNDYAIELIGDIVNKINSVANLSEFMSSLAKIWRASEQLRVIVSDRESKIIDFSAIDDDFSFLTIEIVKKRVFIEFEIRHAEDGIKLIGTLGVTGEMDLEVFHNIYKFQQLIDEVAEDRNRAVDTILTGLSENRSAVFFKALEFVSRNNRVKFEDKNGFWFDFLESYHEYDVDWINLQMEDWGRFVISVQAAPLKEAWPDETIYYCLNNHRLIEMIREDEIRHYNQEVFYKYFVEENDVFNLKVKLINAITYFKQP